MAQVYKMMLGTSGKQWELLTVKDDGTMMLYFHGTDRSVTQEVTVITEGEWKGWLRSEKGSMYPGLASGKWQKMDDVRCKTEDVVETTDNTDDTDNYAEPEIIEETTDNMDLTDNEPVTVNPDCNATLSEREPLTINQPRPRRQRKPRKPRVERQEPAISHQPSDSDRKTSDTMKAVGMVAAASVALLVIWQTGLIIPLGLIGLATSGLLK